MSTLAQQLQGIQANNTQESDTRRRASYLFTPRQAATLSKEEIFGLGQNGFQALLQLEPRLDRFEDVFFSDRAKQTDRTLLSKDENEKLDASVAACLQLLGPNVLIRPCGQFLEWLIRQFRINEFNVKEMLVLMLPYHETPQFAQMLQILEIKPNTPFAPLSAVKAAIQPLPRHTLVASLTKSPDLLRFVVSLLTSALSDRTIHRTLISFWMATLLSYLQLRPTITQDEMTIFLPALFGGIRVRSQPEAQLACYVLLASLATKASLATDAIESIITLISTHRNKDGKNDQAAITTLITILQSQDELPILPEKVTRKLLERPDFVQIVLDLATTHELTLFLKPLCASLVSLYGEEEVNVCVEAFAHPATPKQVLSCLTGNLMDGLLVKEVDELVGVLSKIRQFAPESLEAAVAGREGEKKIQDLLEQVINYGSKASSNLGLKAADRSVRLASLRQALDSKDDASMKEASQALLADDSPEIAALLSTYAETVIASLTIDEIITASKVHLNSDTAARALMGEHVNFLSNYLVSQHPEAASQVVQALWSRLLFTKSGKKSTQAVWDSLTGSALLTSGLLKGCGEMDQTDPSAFNDLLAKRIAANAETEDVPLILAGLDVSAPATSRLLSALVLVYLLPSGKVDAKSMQQLNVEWKNVGSQVPKGTKLFADKSVSSDVLSGVFSKSKSAKSWNAVQACLAARYASSLTVPSAASWSWLQADKDLSNGIRSYQSTVQNLYFAAHTTTHVELATLILTCLFGKLLKQDILPFLASVYTAQDATFAAVALKDTQEVVHAQPNQPFDLQMIVPLLYGPMQHKDRQIRSAAMAVIEAIEQAKTADTVPKTFNHFYGKDTTANVLYLSAKDCKLYLGGLNTARQEVIADPESLSKIHVSIGGPKKSHAKFRRAVFSFAISHADCNGRLPIALAALRAFKQLAEKERLAITLPLWSKLLATPSALDTLSDADAQEYLNLLLEAFLNLDKSVVDTSADVSLAQLVKPLKRSDSKNMLLIRTAMLSFVKEQLYAALSTEYRIKLTVQLLETASADTGADALLRTCIGCVATDVTALTTIMTSLRLNILASQNDVRQAKRSKVGNSTVTALESAMRSSIVLLEATDFLSVQATVQLLSTCFEIASAFVHAQASQSTEIEYAAQLLLSGMMHLATHMQAIPSSAKLDLKPILDIIRISINPQTAQRALLLIAQLAQHMPEQVLQHIVPIFTFMGANVIHKDDAYSNRVVTSVMENVLPALLKPSKEAVQSRTELISSLSDLLRTFTDAATHVPRHRQTSLFTQFVTVLGPKDFLAPTITLLLDQRGQRPPKGEALRDKETFGLAMRLLDAFSPATKLAALGQLVEDIHKLAKELHAIVTDADASLASSRSGSEDIQKRTPRQLIYSASFVAVALGEKALQSKIDSTRSSGNQALDVSLQAIAKKGLLALIEVSDVPEHAGSVEPACDMLVQNVIRLLSLPVFGEVIVWLVSSAKQPVFLRGLSLLADKVSKVTQDRRSLLLMAIDNAFRRISDEIKKVQVVDAGFCRQILEYFSSIGKKSTQSEQGALSQAYAALLEAAPTMLRSQTSLGQTALMTLANLTPAVGTRLIPNLKAAINLGRTSVQNDVGAECSEAGWNLLTALISALPTFTAPHAQDLMGLLFSNSAISSGLSYENFKETLARVTPAKTLYPAIGQIWANQAVSSSRDACAVLDLLKTAFTAASPTDAASIHKSAFRLLLEAFDGARRLDADTADPMLEKARSAYIELVLKLNEATFKPAFLRTVDWAFVAPEDDQTGLRLWRSKTFFGLMIELVVQLKDLILPYLSSVVDHVTSALEDLAAGKIKDLVYWETLLQAVHVLLTTDSQDFWTLNRLRKLIIPLVDQLDQTARFHSDRFAIEYRPVIRELGLRCSEHEALLQQLNKSLLNKTRTDNIDAKAEAVLSIEALWYAVNEPLLPFVAETVPFVIECLEEPEIESATRQLVATMENCLGEESLESYLS